MAQDNLEQLVEDYLRSRGFFTRCNIKYRPDPSHPDYKKGDDSNHSDIDVLGIHPQHSGPDRVWAISCKSWQGGFDVKAKLSELQNNKVRGGRESWKFFRELTSPKWSQAFQRAVAAEAGQLQFTYVLAVTKTKGNKQLWESHTPFRIAMAGNPLKLLSIPEMLAHLAPQINTTLASTHLGRTLQLLKAAGIKL